MLRLSPKILLEVYYMIINHDLLESHTIGPYFNGKITTQFRPYFLNENFCVGHWQIGPCPNQASTGLHQYPNFLSTKWKFNTYPNPNLVSCRWNRVLIYELAFLINELRKTLKWFFKPMSSLFWGAMTRFRSKPNFKIIFLKN